MSFAVRISDLRFSWPGSKAPILDISELQIATGQHTLIMGPSGTGKSTLLNLLAGILDVSSGNVEILGQDICALSADKRDVFRADNIGYIFQRFNLVPYLSVLENVTLPCSMSTSRRKAVSEKPELAAKELLLGLDIAANLLRKPAAQLSVGQQQRVAAARCLIGSPPLIIADEPTSSLDEANQKRFLSILLQEADRANATVLFVSHDTRLRDMFSNVIELAAINRALTEAA